jgi:hypothetical protein
MKEACITLKRLPMKLCQGIYFHVRQQKNGYKQDEFTSTMQTSFKETKTYHYQNKNQ